ncbi:MAG: transporter, family, lactate transporter [Acetobacteraceae bacterium]|jgi:SHS family lactate transporter-like MFS transporter|nr:transporter, family, lactate transporter [Acetobacteraceae bacterium]
MSYSSGSSATGPWWREPTKDNWYAFIASWLGWTLDAFDFTVFLFLLVPIAKEFNADLTLVVLVGSLTMWMRFAGAVAAGWMSDRMGRRAPLMISILWYSACNFIAGFSPTFLFLLVFRTLLGIGMGAEWPAGAALATESWPARSRGLMSAVLQGSWALGYLLAAVLYATVYDYIGWRGMLWMGVLPALAVLWIRVYVKEPEVWIENQKQQKAKNAQVKVPLAAIFRKGVRVNTLTCCWWLISAFVVYYSIFGLFATYMTRELHLTASQVGWPLAFSNGLTFIASFVWGSLTDSIGRRWAMIIPAVIGAAIAPIYLLTTDYTMIVVAFSIQGAFAGAIYGINPSYANERFPTEIRATAAAFCYHMGAVVGGFVPPLLTYFAIERQMGFAVPMLIGTVGGLISFVVTLFFSPETKGQIMEADLKIVSAAQAH